jgi:hypothetical protein
MPPERGLCDLEQQLLDQEAEIGSNHSDRRSLPKAAIAFGGRGRISGESGSQ